ncbi:hypothetical protein T05_7044 [Trichinella murrelli]|uniref:Uncharacterized protein n=1 Tax=Trichinella murrelli TaxID=144512 RepID=A0A0V0TZ24_9BILA|nr:hypothetical protein T05_7044 [Trichinella murrelli]
MREIFLLIVYFYSLPAASRFDNSCFKCKSYYPGFYVVVKQQRGREGSKLIKVKKDFLQPTITTTFQLDNAYHHNSAPHNTNVNFQHHASRFQCSNNLFEKKNVIPPRFSDEFYCLIHLSLSLDDLFAKIAQRFGILLLSFMPPFYCST